MKIFLIIVLTFITILILISFLLVQNPEERSVDVFQEMIYSPSYSSFEPNSNFKDGKTLQLPVKGTIMRGALTENKLKLDVKPVIISSTLDSISKLAKVEEAEKAKILLKRAKEDAISRGSEQYRIYCSVCHGLSGIGDGLVVKKGYPAPPSLLFPKYVQMPDEQIYKTITYGFNNMSSYASLIDREDRWKIIAYIRKLQSTVNVAQADVIEKDSTIISPLETTE